MNQSNSGDDSNPKSSSADEGLNIPQTIKRYNLGAMLKEQPELYRIIELSIAQMEYLALRLRGRVALMHNHINQFIEIRCVKAVDYSIRPPNPAILMGGPLIEFYE